MINFKIFVKEMVLTVFLLALVNLSWAQIKLPAIIADEMVLQQKTKVNLWGWAIAGESVSILASWDHQILRTIADINGNWTIPLHTPKAGGPYTLTITGKNKIVINNVLLGEVWLCSGQSNMTFPLGKQATSWQTGVFNYEQEIAAADYPRLRMFTVKQTIASTPKHDVEGKWETCTPQTAGKFSAVAYYFGREILKGTGFPVGLIHSSWGGTPAESWTKKEVLENDAELIKILEEYQKRVKDYPLIKQAYEMDLAKLKNEGSTKPIPKAPVNPGTDYKAPTVLFNAMISPLLPYTLKGVIWYQGESNSDRASQYQKLFPTLINHWRKDFGQDLPFYFVQIAMHYQKKPEIREAQLITYRQLRNTGMVVITDVGDSLDIHPRNKETVGKRLALWPMAKLYHRQKAFSGPLYKSKKVEGNKIRIWFDFGEGLLAKDGDLREFEIAGADKQFVPAKAIIEGNTVVIQCNSITKPVAVRFAWKNFSRPNLFNFANLPASPFRTDNWE
ncbi:sialate O-acetylesterase [Pedobacter insulae]|uniref:Sialate O-acetylesterase n=1 Tax=Pedobacter insulae TaxID=414048 RepID=A0A1I2UXT9_9SPHI|nr:sialate O-acetylesterase [Pedobacter insulae]SFG81850.1 sialate O-acetylesterase [Pedobacter insulae]